MRFLRRLPDWSRVLGIFWARTNFLWICQIIFERMWAVSFHWQTLWKLEFETEAWRLIFQKRSVIYQKKRSEEIFGGYIYLELSKKILFHQTRPLMRFRKEDFNQGDKTLRRLKGWPWSMSHKCCNSMHSLSAWPATGWVKKGGSGEFDCQCFKLWRSRRS